MAEIMFHHDPLTEEYLHMLISYLRPDGPFEHQDGNFLEMPSLQRGLLWGIGRLAERRAAMLIAHGVVADLLPYLQSEDGGVRGLAAWSLGRLRAAVGRDTLLPLTADSSQVRLYQQGQVQVFSVADLVENALLRITTPYDS
jgi:hypothetical protein